MSSLQVAALGAIAGFTIFLGLPFGRLQEAVDSAEGGFERGRYPSVDLPRVGHP